MPRSLVLFRISDNELKMLPTWFLPWLELHLNRHRPGWDFKCCSSGEITVSPHFESAPNEWVGQIIDYLDDWLNWAQENSTATPLPDCAMPRAFPKKRRYAIVEEVDL